MGRTSKDLQHLEHTNPSSSSLSLAESALLICNKKKPVPQAAKPDTKPTISSVPKSQVLGQVQNFLGILGDANKRLELDAKGCILENSGAYDIEVLTGNESQVIEMDLMLGVADLHTPEAIASAEAAVAGYQPIISLAGNSSSSESDDAGQSSDDADHSNAKRTDSNVKVPISKKSNSGSNKRFKKKAKIVELS